MTCHRMSLRLPVLQICALVFCCLALTAKAAAEQGKLREALGGDGSLTATAPCLLPAEKPAISPGESSPFAEIQRIVLNKEEQLWINSSPRYEKEPSSGPGNIVCTERYLI